MAEIVCKPDLGSISEGLIDNLSGVANLLLSWDEDLTDFRLDRAVTVRVHSRDNTVVLTLPAERKFLSVYATLLFSFLFTPGNVVMVWDAKPLFTYLKHRFGRHFLFSVGNILHLKASEAYCGVSAAPPLTYWEASRRAAAAFRNGVLGRVNKEVWTPLTTDVLPSMETFGLVSRGEGPAYCSYQVEGQKNGRLGCSRAFQGCFVPQAMDADQKRRYTAGPGRKFLSFDYKHMEFSVLQWLSKDEALGGLIDSGEDLYSAVSRQVLGSNRRAWMKDVLIWLLYGMGARTLAEKTGMSVEAAERLIARVHVAVPAMAWLDAQDGAVGDCFGRVFDDRTPTSVRNGLVQSPTALICLEKLVLLHRDRPPTANVVASVHDGFVLAVDDVLPAARWGCELLESESPWAPGLKLRVEARAGDNWAELPVINF